MYGREQTGLGDPEKRSEYGTSWNTFVRMFRDWEIHVVKSTHGHSTGWARRPSPKMCENIWTGGPADGDTARIAEALATCVDAVLHRFNGNPPSEYWGRYDDEGTRFWIATSVAPFSGKWMSPEEERRQVRLELFAKKRSAISAEQPSSSSKGAE